MDNLSFSKSSLLPSCDVRKVQAIERASPNTSRIGSPSKHPTDLNHAQVTQPVPAPIEMGFSTTPPFPCLALARNSDFSSKSRKGRPQNVHFIPDHAEHFLQPKTVTHSSLGRQTNTAYLYIIT